MSRSKVSQFREFHVRGIVLLVVKYGNKHTFSPQ